ncbi:hypothetical protein ACFWNL_18245 [Kitasatospora sp. NPDC058397]|uniref:hypothetical protein n=1 Tax=unclassified Kitasatospora TaxID=2633591 RepID=UPI00364A0512
MDTATAFNAPAPADAYAQAPDLDAEAYTVGELLDELDPGRRPDFYPPASDAERREVLLRLAAVADRRWTAQPTVDNALAADRAAHKLMDFDRHHPAEADDSLSPWSPQWHGSSGNRAYVRHAYGAWLNDPITEDCNNCQGETCRACNRPVPAPADGPAAADGGPAARVHLFLAADPRATVCGHIHGPDGPVVLAVSDMYAVLTGEATKAQERQVRTFVAEFDSLRDTDHPDDNDRIAAAPGGSVLHSSDVCALLDDLDPAREDPSDVLPLLLTWPDATTEHRIRRDQLAYLLAYVEELADENT